MQRIWLSEVFSRILTSGRRSILWFGTGPWLLNDGRWSVISGWLYSWWRVTIHLWLRIRWWIATTCNNKITISSQSRHLLSIIGTKCTLILWRRISVRLRHRLTSWCIRRLLTVWWWIRHYVLGVSVYSRRKINVQR